MKKQNVRTLSFIVSTFTYLLVGAAIFDALESQTEESNRRDLESIELDYKQKFNISNDDYKELEEIVNRYHPYRTFPQWKFAGAFYFSLTVITTIGYGHSTPQTILGKIFCMIYAIVGIPLCLIMFQSVGERLNYFASFCIQLVKKCFRFRKKEVNQTELVCVGGVLAIAVITGGASMFSYYEGWSYFDSIYYCVITLTTIGFGDFVALQDKNNLSNTSYVILSFTFILFGLTVVASSMNLLVLKFLTMNTDDERREYTEAQRNRSNLRFSSTDLINIVNGNTLCDLEPGELDDLRKENTFILCFPSKYSFIDYIQNKFFYKQWRSNSKMELDNNNNQELMNYLNNNNNNNNNDDSVNCGGGNGDDDENKKRPLQIHTSTTINTTNKSTTATKRVICCSSHTCCLKRTDSQSSRASIELDKNLYQFKSGLLAATNSNTNLNTNTNTNTNTNNSSFSKKKSQHYTVVRAPGEIQHLTTLSQQDQQQQQQQQQQQSVVVRPLPPKIANKSSSPAASQDKDDLFEVSVFIDEDADTVTTEFATPLHQSAANAANNKLGRRLTQPSPKLTPKMTPKLRHKYGATAVASTTTTTAIREDSSSSIEMSRLNSNNSSNLIANNRVNNGHITSAAVAAVEAETQKLLLKSSTDAATTDSDLDMEDLKRYKIVEV